MYFYELHEGDDDLFSDVLLARETEMAPDVFFETVQAIRRRLGSTFEDDTLIESIGAELEREHGFIYISDDRLTAAVNVSLVEEENFLADLDADDEAEEAAAEDVEDVEDVEDDDLEDSEAYRTVYARLSSERNRPN